MDPYPTKRTKLSPYFCIPPSSRPSPQGYLDDAVDPEPAPSSNVVDEQTRQATQPLYNKWRDLDEAIKQEQAKKEWFQRQGSLMANADDLLRPPSPSAATDMSRETSQTGSITHTMATMDLDEGQPGGKRKRSTRGGRTGPMKEVDKAQTAFIRATKLTCKPCHDRRVRCTHINMSPWEDVYQSSKAAQTIHSSFLDPLSYVSTISPNSRIGQSRPGISYERPARAIDLVGIGDGRTSTIQNQGGYEDPDNLLELPRAGPVPGQTAPIGIPPRPQRLAGLRLGGPTPVMPEFDFRPESVVPSGQSPKKDLPIGKEIKGGAPGWQCQWGVEGSRSGTSLASGSSEVCQKMFPNLHELKNHYTWTHTFFGEYEWPYLSVCSSCDTYDSWPPPSSCMHCDEANVAWEKWYHGWIVGSPSLPVEHQIRLTASQPQPGPARFRYRQTGGNHTHTGVFHFQGYTGGAGPYYTRSHDGHSASGAEETPALEPMKEKLDDRSMKEATFDFKQGEQPIHYPDPSLKTPARSLTSRTSKAWLATRPTHMILLFFLLSLLIYAQSVVRWAVPAEPQWRSLPDRPTPPPTSYLCHIIVCCEARETDGKDRMRVALVIGCDNRTTIKQGVT